MLKKRTALQRKLKNVFRLLHVLLLFVRTLYVGWNRRRGDVDAPDLKAPLPPASRAVKPVLKRQSRLNGSERMSYRAASKIATRLEQPILYAETSANLRDQLLAETKTITSSDEAAIWAHRILGIKNSLTELDASQVEEAFRTKLAALEEIDSQSLQQPPANHQTIPSGFAQQPARSARQAETNGIDKSRLAHPEPRRFRDKEHVKFVAKQTCLICGRRPADAHHLRFAQHRALGRKVSDEFTVPLCRGHHREAHRSGDEAGWWKTAGIDPAITARALWLETHPLPTIPGTPDRD